MDTSAPRRIRFKAGTARDFCVSALARKPALEVVSLSGSSAHVAGGKHHGAKGQSQTFQDILGVGSKLFELVIALFRTRELHQLHFLELMLSNAAARTPPIGSGFAAEAGCVSAQLDGKLAGIQRFVPKQVGYWYFRRGRQPKIVILNLKQIVLEFRELPCAEQAGRVDQERRKNFCIAVLAGVHVQHEVDERPL